jgi:hypothetical protein
MRMLMGKSLRYIAVRYLKSLFPKIPQQAFAGVLKQMEDPSAYFSTTISYSLPKAYLDKEDAITGTLRLYR